MKLYVGNLSWETRSDDLRDAFSKVAEVTDAQVIEDRGTGRSKGFAFVTAVDQAAAEAMIRDMDGQDFMGRMIKVNISEEPKRDGGDRGGGGGRGGGSWGGDRGGGDRGGGGGSWGGGGGSGGVKLYIGNLSWEVKTETLFEDFGGICEVVDAVVMEDRETGRSRGFGFLTVKDQETANMVIEECNEREFYGRAIRINVSEDSGKGGGSRRGGYGDRGGGGYGDRGGDRGGGGGPRDWGDRAGKYGSSAIPDGRWR